MGSCCFISPAPCDKSHGNCKKRRKMSDPNCNEKQIKPDQKGPALLDRQTIASITDQAADILADIGVAFETQRARDLFTKHGATVHGKRVKIPASLLEQALKNLPEPTGTLTGKKRVTASSPFGNAPMIQDVNTGQFRRGTIADAVTMYQLAETSDLYASANPGVADPQGNDSEDPFLGQIAMMLKYSDRRPAIGLRATRSNTRHGDVRFSAKKAIHLIKEIKEADTLPVMAQGICPMAPLSYDEECLMNLEALVEEAQDITIIPCTLTFMTGPESLMGTVIHDIAISLAGIVYVQLLKPGTGVSFSSSSTMTDLKTMQPSYGSPEYLYSQIMFYEVCRYLQIKCTLCGCLSDSRENDYQSGFESCMTALAPFSLTSVQEVFCSPGLMASFAGAGFTKMILDEEMVISCNRLLQGLDLSMDPLLKDKLKKSLDTGSFLSIGSAALYRKEQRVTRIFDKTGIRMDPHTSQKGYVADNVSREIEKRCAAYVLPARSKTQKNLLQKYLPTPCKY
ncbi:MAG: trimethylamine methyltransferase family protein [Desulfotignum sp.]|nr:trimethylamine methyltransferase family protein [Desulfobacteraceae bacterium]